VILLDTHIFLWWLFDDPQLSDNLRRKIRDMDITIFISAASVWEISTKYRIGKLPQAGTVAADVPKWIVKAGFQPMAIKPEHAQMAGMWEMPHKDPFDRMLAAQSRIEKMPLATIDKMLEAFPIDLIH